MRLNNYLKLNGKYLSLDLNSHLFISKIYSLFACYVGGTAMERYRKLKIFILVTACDIVAYKKYIFLVIQMTKIHFSDIFGLYS